MDHYQYAVLLLSIRRLHPYHTHHLSFFYIKTALMKISLLTD